MTDVGTQLREYLDATAPAVELEEIFVERVGTPPVRPLHPRRTRQPIPGWVYAVAAAIVVVALVGGTAWLLRGDPEVEPTDQPTVTTVPDETVPPDQQTETAPDSALEVVEDAFDAIHDADWQRFLSHIDPEGPLAETTPAGQVRLPGQGQLSSLGGVDHDGDRRISAAEDFLIQAQYLALAPIRVLDCEDVGDAEVCRVEDTSVFHRAAGFEPSPIRVTVRNGFIIDITTQREPFMALGGCDGCTWDSWQWSAYEYHLWLGLIPPEAVCPPGTDFPDMGAGGCESASLPPDYISQLQADPLFVGWASMSSGGGFSEFPWIKPESFAEHRQLIPQWLAARQSSGVADGIEQIEALIAASQAGDTGGYLALFADDAQMLGVPLDAAAEEALLAANMVWSLDECAVDADGVVSCSGTRRDDFHGAAGLVLQGTFSFALAGGRIAGVEFDPTVQQQSLDQHLAFAVGFRSWLDETHPDVVDTFRPAVAGGIPSAADMPAALDHVTEYGTHLTAEHRTVVEDLLDIYNAGSIAEWQTIFREVETSGFAPDATEPTLEAEASLMAANAEWVLDGDCQLTGTRGETRLTCPTLRSDDFFGAGGLDRRIHYDFTFAADGRVTRYSTVGGPATNSDWFDDHMQFTDQFKEWLHSVHPEVATSAGFPREGELPDWIPPALMPIALLYVDEFVAQSTEWP